MTFPMIASRRAGAALAAFALVACSERPEPVEPAGSAFDPRAPFQVPGLAVETALAEAGRPTRSFAVPAQVEFDPTRCATVVARVDGVVARVHVELGDEVVAGTPLVELDSREVAAARALLVDARQRAEFAADELAREERLFAREATSEVELRAAKRAAAEAQLAVDSASEALVVLGLSLTPLEGKAREASSDDAGGHAEESMARIVLRAPTSGQIVAREVTLGEAAGAGDVLFEIADASRLWVQGRIPVATLAALSLDDEIRVGSEDLGVDVVTRIEYVDPRIDAGTQSALARAEVQVEGGLDALRPGLFVELRGTTAAEVAEVTVPALAVQRVDGEDWVFVDERGAWSARRVEVGRRGDECVEILDGLRGGETVATSATLTLKAVWLGLGGEE